MSFNGSGTFVVNSSGQPVVTGTVISSTAFNALTADLATGLSTCVTKDGQTATTVRVPFAFGISSTLTTDATSTTTGSIITAGGISTQKALWVGTTSRHVGATQFDAAITYGGVTLSNAVTGTGNMVLSASPTLSGTLTAATVTTTGNVQIGDGVADSFSVGCASPTTGDNQQSFIHKGLTFFSGTGATPAGVIGNNFYQNGNLLYRQTGFASYINFSSVDGHIGLNFAASGLADASASFTEKVTFATSGATTFASTIASGAITSTGAVTGTYFTPTATGNNGLGLAAANTPAFYASTTEVMRSTTALITAVKPIKANALYKDTTSVSVPTSTATTIITSIPYTDGLMLVETHQGTTTGGACIIACQSNPVIVAQWSTYSTHTFSISGQALQLTTNLGTATYTTTYTYLGTKNA